MTQFSNPLSHIDLRVKDMEEALPFYTTLLTELGFTRTFHNETWKVFVAEGEVPGAGYFTITEEPESAPNRNRIAFWASSRDEVDRLAGVVDEAGGTINDGPELCPEYTPTYYAVFFQSPGGHRFEIVHRTS